MNNYSDRMIFLSKEYLKELGLVALTILLGYFFWAVSPDFDLPIKTVLGVIIPIIFVLFIFLLYYKTKSDINPFARVNSGRLRYEDDPNSTLLCILDPSNNFFRDMLVSFYYLDDYEELIGIGTVSDIQVDGRIQVEMDYYHERYKQIINKLKNNNKKTLLKTIVKPYVPKKELEKLYSLKFLKERDRNE